MANKAGPEIPKDYREIVNHQIDTHGWRYELGKKHAVLYPADRTKASIRIPSTPSDQRGLRNFIAQVKRSGGTWPPNRK